MKISEKIKLLRTSFNQNQKEFAQSLGVTQSTISKYEKGLRQPDYQFISDLFELLGVNPNWLFRDKEPMILSIDYLYYEDDYGTNELLLQDLISLIEYEDLTEKLSNLLFEELLKILVVPEVSYLDKSLNRTIKLVLEPLRSISQSPFRPFLLIYSLLKFLNEHLDELKNINNPKEYVKKLIQNYETLSFKSYPRYTASIKKNIIASYEINLTDNDFSYLFKNSGLLLKRLEKSMTSALILAHKDMDIDKVFPK